MKKFLLFMLVPLVALTLAGCQKKVEIKDALSEVTKVYYQASNEELSASICAGDREEKYVIDGKHGKTCEFTLISIKFNDQQNVNSMGLDFVIDGVETKVVLELNPANHMYMADLGYALKDESEISLAYNGKTLTFENVSKNFSIDYNKAISIALENFGEELKSFYNGGSFEVECYLKVLTLRDNGKEDLFWIFTIVGKDKQTKNIVLNVNDGNIIIKN